MHQVIMAVENILNLLPSYESTPVSFHAKHLIDNLVANGHDGWWMFRDLIKRWNDEE